MATLEAAVAVVTGAASGMGRACAGMLAQRGAPVALLDVDRSGAEEAAAAIVAKGGTAVPIHADVGDSLQVQRAFEEVQRAIGPPYVVAAAAGVLPHDVPIWELSDAEAERAVRVNLLGVIYTVREAARRMITAGRGGRVILWSSIAARLSDPLATVYCATKAGIEGLTRALAADLGRHAITVNAIAPGAVDTPMIAHVSDFRRAVEALLTPVSRIGHPDDIARLVCWLASDEASWITGAVIPVDGGLGAVNSVVEASRLIARALRGELRGIPNHEAGGA